MLRKHITPEPLLSMGLEDEAEEVKEAERLVKEAEAKAEAEEAARRAARQKKKGRRGGDEDDEPQAAAPSAAPTSAAMNVAEEEPPTPQMVLFSVNLALMDDTSYNIGYSPQGEEWEALLVSFVSKPVDVLAAVGSILNEPALQEFITAQAITAESGITMDQTNPPGGSVSGQNVPTADAASRALETAGESTSFEEGGRKRGSRSKAGQDEGTDLQQLLAMSAAPHVHELRELVRSNYIALEELVEEYTGHGQLYKENTSFNAERLRGKSLEAFRTQMVKFEAQVAVYGAMPEAVSVGIFSANASSLKKKLSPSPADCLTSVRTLVPNIADEQSQSILDETRACEKKLQTEPEGIAKFVEYALFLQVCPDKHASLEKRWEQSEELYALMDEFNILPSEGSKATRKALHQSLNTMGDTLSNHQSGYEEKLHIWAERILAELSELRKRAADERLKAEIPLLFDGKTPIDVVREHLGQTRMIVRDLTEQANLFEQWQRISLYLLLHAMRRRIWRRQCVSQQSCGNVSMMVGLSRRNGVGCLYLYLILMRLIRRYYAIRELFSRRSVGCLQTLYCRSCARAWIHIGSYCRWSPPCAIRTSKHPTLISSTRSLVSLYLVAISSQYLRHWRLVYTNSRS